ncbi:hypothetical protein CH354_16065 [Leptospira levettii]|uniref:class I SAM-dependent methyltransferase n=1 Tax=Leptospira levettii TaxID=2023178 RepID=UPI000C2B27CC|nr:class I SAM-dependent methyltransferase [Leptospira levettii]MCW7472046.1 class I SAM-dependent methyltransferase [Leptospira levettii]PJZ36175.1 hypothetical protein CH354_16065 [Leptospira levettii]PJZ90161.1 hypothetical protein CH368_03085 [Leptospira levettii]PJZ99853.1 hypothetical protein CH369_12175 [Leptospira levettii]
MVELFLKNFPKKRIKLPDQYMEIYEKEYIINRTGSSIFNKIALYLESWMHRKVASCTENVSDVLELGAGSLNHLKYESRFKHYDVIEPFKELLNESKQSKTVRSIFSDISEVDKKQKYDKILSVAVLEHLLDLPKQVFHSCIRLAKGGTFVAGIPSEGALLWYLAYKYGTGTGFKIRTGLDYELFMKYEHVNNAHEIESVVRYFFRNVVVYRFPFPFFHFSLYSVIVAKEVNEESLAEYSKLSMESIY